MNEPTKTEKPPETAVTTQQPRERAPVLIGPRGVQITDMDSLWRFAQYVVKSGFAPKGMQTAEAVFIAIEMGLEVGLPPMAAIQNIAVINGRPSIYGDAMLGICRSSGDVMLFEEWYEQDGKRLARNPVKFTDDVTAVCRVQRRGFEASETGFSVADAKRAELFTKPGNWQQYPARMLRFRARGFALRDQFGDWLKGMKSAEEAADDPVEAAKPANTGFVPRKNAKDQKPDAAHITEVESEKVTQFPTSEAQGATTAPEPDKSSEDPTQTASALQADWRDLCGSMGVEFEDFRGWLVTTGRFKDADSIESWAGVPDAVLEPLVEDKKAVSNLRTLYGKAGK